jgi:hypothetical protein
MDQEHQYQAIARKLLRGKVVPFLGAGANLCGAEVDVSWRDGDRFPSGAELAEHLADYANYRDPDRTNLSRVAQYIALMEGPGSLYDLLHPIFDDDHAPTPIHRLLASLPSMFRTQRALGKDRRHPLLVTTNYDDALERALEERDEPFDVVTYIAAGELRGQLHHRRADGSVVAIERANEYADLALEDRTILLKVHGTVDRVDPLRDSYVITEEDYIDYLTRSGIDNLLPALLVAELRSSHLLFLGYSLSDWNLRAILHRLWGARKLAYTSWSIQRAPDGIDQKMWAKRDVEIIDDDLLVAAEHLGRALAEQQGS